MEQNKITLGVDRGNGLVKSSSCVKYISGSKVKEFGRPEVGENIYEVSIEGGDTYIVGAERNQLQLNPLKSKAMYIQTLPAIARGIDAEIANGRIEEGAEVEVELIVGVPISHYTTERKVQYMSYYLGKKQFKCNGTEYKIDIKEVKVTMQGYAAYLHNYGSLKDHKHIDIVDIGSGTIDIFEVEAGKPVQDSFISLPLGTVHLIDAVRNRFNMIDVGRISDESIRAIISNEDPGFEVTEDMKKAVEREVNDYFSKLFFSKELADKGYRWNKAICWMGGGAQMLHDYILDSYSKDTVTILNEYCNAKAYKALAPRLK